ncbi:unnamed protein product [Alternaria alternata]
MSQTTFKHIPLTRPAEQIRLLKLQPDTDVIRLNIQTYELAECPEFVALSYEWGNGSEIHDIIIDGAVFKIRQNLRDALEHIRTLQADTSSTRLFEEDSPYFWIDAISIDQSNDTEKPHQVSIMGKIYHQAWDVIAWLGLEQNGDDSALALDYLNASFKLPLDYQIQPSDSVEISTLENAISKLCHRSYFRRVWIVQECVLAIKLHLVCGLHYCSWEHLHKFNKILPDGRQSRSVDELFRVRLVVERYQKRVSIQQLMSEIMDVTADRQCSRFHDRIYGLLGILQQNSQTTGMDVNYGASLEELMIKTQEFLTEGIDHNAADSQIIMVFESVASIDVQGKVAWYWNVNQIMHKLDTDVIQGFHSLETLRSEKGRALTFQTICWIVGGYGVDLFSSTKGTTSLDIATTMRNISLEFRKNESVSDLYYDYFLTVHSRYIAGNYTYCISLTHPHDGFHAIPDDYMMTESNSWECRSLLEAYSKQVQSLGKMRESFKVSTEVSDPEMLTRLPIQVEWMVFSNLLAQYYLSTYSPGDFSPSHRRKAGGFVRQIEREGKDLDTFLSESLFDKYRMSVASTSDQLPANALKSVEIEITNSSDADDCSGCTKKTLVASLYDNDAWDKW